MKQKIGIRVLSLHSGVSEYNIRSWEKRYGILTPERTKGGHRLYSEKDILILRGIKNLLKSGHNISNIATWPISKILKAIVDPSEDKRLESGNYKDHSLGIILALKSFKLDLLEHEMLKARQSLSIQDFILDLVLPCMKTVGSLYQNGEISIA